jgi:hypothetical protein
MNMKKITDYLYHSNFFYGKILSAIINGWKLVIVLPLLFSLMLMLYMNFYNNKYIVFAQINQNYSEKIDLSTLLVDLKDFSSLDDSVKQVCSYKASNSEFNALVNSIDIKKISTSKYSVTFNLSGKNLDQINECNQVMLAAIKDFYIKYYRIQIDKNIFNIKNNNTLIEEMLSNINFNNNIKSYLKLNFLNEIISDNFQLNKSNLYLEKAINDLSIGNINVSINKPENNKKIILSVIFGILLAILIVAKREILITFVPLWRDPK